MSFEELLRHLVVALEDLDIPYALVGSVASMAYGEPRTTRDIDVVADGRRHHLGALRATFPEPQFFLDEVAADQAIEQRGSFQILGVSSGFKIDVFLPNSSLDRRQIADGRRMGAVDELEASFAPPEELIVHKMLFYREGGPDKHLRDIASMIEISGGEIDLDRVGAWAMSLGLTDIWSAIRERPEHP